MSDRLASGADTAPVVAGSGDGTSFACSVLMIDDDRLYLDMAASYLRGHGHRVRTATCPLEALDAIADEPPDAVTIDCGLTSLSEFSLLTEIQRRFPDVRAIVLSNRSGAVHERMMRAFGANGVVSKRSGGEGLMEALATV